MTQPKQALTPAADYLKSDEIGLVISKGMAVLYKTNPKNPVDFLAKWLLNYSHVQKAARAQIEQEAAVMQSRKFHLQYCALEEEKAKDKLSEENKQQKAIDDLLTRLEQSDDPKDNLQELVDQLKQATNATAVYIGKLVQPTKPIKEGSTDQDHENPDAEHIIRFCHSNKEHAFMIDKCLRSDQGLTFDVFKDLEEEKKDEAAEEAEENAEGQEEKMVAVEEKEVFPRHIDVPEVVREPRMHFFRVPRLGSYCAIRLEYQSCLSVEAFDAGLQDMLSVFDRQKQRAEDIKAWEETQREMQEEAEAAGEAFTPEQKVFEEIEMAPFKTEKVTYVVCLNTMGQDRRFTEEERKIALRTIQRFRDTWEAIEGNNLEKDIEAQIEHMEMGKKYREAHEALDNAEIEIKSEQMCPKESDEPVSDSVRKINLEKAKFTLYTRGFFAPEEAALFQKQKERERLRAMQNNEAHDEGEEEKYSPCVPQQWKEEFLKLKDLHVIKFPRVLQTLLFMLKYTREEICERDTCKLDFKKVKALINEKLLSQMSNYNPSGPRDGQYKVYQKLRWLNANLPKFDEGVLEEQSLILSKIYQWVQQGLNVRRWDVEHRMGLYYDAKAEREQAIAADKERTERMNAALEEAKAAHEAKIDEEHAKLDALEEEDEENADKPKPERERPPFDMEDFQEQFDEHNPPISIPAEVKMDIDADYDLDYKGQDDKEDAE